ncbi:sigma factor [Paractinoplanes hotanensis]|uniref:RNA polymerase sigma-70 region 2 domain-containing protein n=1 Tax=Paractinoplanes hotanensis TaxID=2906497 RepID=A0ABT0XWK3_9ACTN|nr:sigma factor [Actinoplanes hotanensis]MCM4078172.1 hypothetical protein [Actinoplanes hotanensis]
MQIAEKRAGVPPVEPGQRGGVTGRDRPQQRVVTARIHPLTPYSRWVAAAGAEGSDESVRNPRVAADDLVQETLAKAYSNWRKVQRADSPSAYVRRILINESRRGWCRNRKHTVESSPPRPLNSEHERVSVLGEWEPAAEANRAGRNAVLHFGFRVVLPSDPEGRHAICPIEVACEENRDPFARRSSSPCWCRWSR